MIIQSFHTNGFFTSFWIIPLIMMLLAVILSVSMIYIDIYIIADYSKMLDNIYGLHGALRSLLSVVASAIITMITFTFSMTVLILSYVANQLGPRIIPNVMNQKVTQVILGFFVATFIYTITIFLSLIYMETQGGFPLLSVVVNIAFSIIAIFALIYFICFIGYVIQFDNILEFIVNDIDACLHRLKDENHSNSTSDNQNTLNVFEAMSSPKTAFALKPGYIQKIDIDALLKFAEQNNLFIYIPTRVGKYIYHEKPLVIVYGHKIPDKSLEKLPAYFLIGKQRSTYSDVCFCFQELSEITLRALSPSLNNPYGSMHAIDRIFSCFAKLSPDIIPSPVVIDNQDVARIVRDNFDHNDILCNALKRIRQQAENDVLVAIHILQKAAEMTDANYPSGFIEALANEIDTLFSQIVSKNLSERDQDDLKAWYQKANENLEKLSAINKDR